MFLLSDLSLLLNVPLFLSSPEVVSPAPPVTPGTDTDTPLSMISFLERQVSAPTPVDAPPTPVPSTPFTPGENFNFSKYNEEKVTIMLCFGTASKVIASQVIFAVVF